MTVAQTLHRNQFPPRGRAMLDTAQSQMWAQFVGQLGWLCTPLVYFCIANQSQSDPLEFAPAMNTALHEQFTDNERTFFPWGQLVLLMPVGLIFYSATKTFIMIGRLLEQYADRHQDQWRVLRPRWARFEKEDGRSCCFKGYEEKGKMFLQCWRWRILVNGCANLVQLLTADFSDVKALGYATLGNIMGCLHGTGAPLMALTRVISDSM